MSSLRFQVYLPSKNGPELALSSSTPSASTTSDAFSTFSSVTHHNPKTIRSQQKRPAMMILQSNSVSIPTSMVENSYIHPRVYISVERDPKFLRILNRYRRIHHRSFPRTPCGHCAILLLDRHIIWSEKRENFNYGLTTILNIPLVERILHRNGVDVKCVAICGICSRRPRSPPLAGPWPDVLLNLPQRSQIGRAHV